MKWIDEPVAGYPKSPVACDEAAAKELKARTLTNLYNTRPPWLTDAHVALDAAMAAAYGWEGIFQTKARYGSCYREMRRLANEKAVMHLTEQRTASIMCATVPYRGQRR